MGERMDTVAKKSPKLTSWLHAGSNVKVDWLGSSEDHGTGDIFGEPWQNSAHSTRVTSTHVCGHMET